MPIKTNLKSMTPRREAFKKELPLLSHGAGNKVAWPDGKIMVYPWDSTVDDLVLSGGRGNPRTLLFDILEKVCDLKGALDDFFVDEVNLVLLTSRALGNDGIITYKSTCPNPVCGNEARERVRVPDDLEPLGEKKPDWPGFDTIKLPVSMDHVRVRPLQIKDEKIIMQRPADKKTLIGDNGLRVIMHIHSTSADGQDWGQPSSIEELVTWYNALPPKDAKFLEEQERALSPHANTLIPHKCEVCQRQFTHLLTFDADFFR